MHFLPLFLDPAEGGLITITSSPKLHRVHKLHHVIQESATVAGPSSFGQLLCVLLELGHFRVLDRHVAVALEIILAQFPSELLIGSAADAEDGQAAGYLFVVAYVLVGIESTIIFLDSILLIQPIEGSARVLAIPRHGCIAARGKQTITEV